MQKKLLAVAVLSAFSGLAAAQSANVTLYGTLQSSVEMRSATGADDQLAPAASRDRSSFRTGATTYNATPTEYSSRMASQSAGSNFGIRGTEDLGNGLSAFFQIEISTAGSIGGPSAPAATTGGTLMATYRNSALGLRSNTWGSVSFGQWDVPFDTMGNNSINGATAGPSTNVIYSILGGNAAASGAVSAQTFDAMCNAGGGGAVSATAGTLPGAVGAFNATTFQGSVAACLNHGMNFSARRSGLLQWWSPNWNGFEVRVGYQPTQFTAAQNSSATGAVNGTMLASTAAVVGTPAAAGVANSLSKLAPSAWDLAASYTNGGLRVTAAYQAKKDFVAQAVRQWYTNLPANGGIGGAQVMSIGSTGGAAAAAGNVGLSQDISSSKDRGYRLGASYRFGMGLTLGALYENLKWNMSYGSTGVGTNSNVTELKNTAWRLQANYVTGKHTFTGEYSKKSDTTGSVDNAAISFNGGASGAKSWILGYAYTFSKRTSMMGYYTSIVNDTNAAYNPTFGGIGAARGQDHKYYGVGVRHAF